MYEFISNHSVAAYVIYLLWIFGGFGWATAAQNSLNKKFSRRACLIIFLIWPLAGFFAVCSHIVVSGKNEENR